MLPARFAIATVIVCIGILLLSACGLNLSPPIRPLPQVLASRFAVYTLGVQPELLATGEIDGTTDLTHIPGRITFATPDCLKGQQIELTGSLSPTLYLSSVTGLAVRLIAQTSPLYHPRTIEAVPFAGVLTRSGTCASLPGIAVDVRPIGR